MFNDVEENDLIEEVKGMEEKGLRGIFDRVIEEDAERKRRRKQERKEMTLKDYIVLIEKDPLITQNSPARLLEIIESAGIMEIPQSERWGDCSKSYVLFNRKLFGIDKSLANMVDFFRQGAQRLSTGKQLLLLVGPTASGKSTCVNSLKRALEAYRNRPVFAIKGCPLREEPLHLLARYLREPESSEDPDWLRQFKRRVGGLNIRIEGDLCPHCRYMLETQYTDEDGTIRWWDVPVETFTFSIQGARGIGSFEPSEEKSQDVTQLVGKENIAISSTKGPDHPLAYSLSGELEIANRGIFEGRELIKSKEEIMWTFISVAEEKEIKVQGSTFPHISVDVVIIGHTNLTEFNRFSSNQANEALHDRIYVVQFPYPLRVREEMRIYRKLIEEESDFEILQDCHIAPGALELAAQFAIMTRLTPSEKVPDLVAKMKIYNGERVLTDLKAKQRIPIDLRELIDDGQSPQEVGKREGMFGVSSRDVLAALNKAIVQESEANGCLTPLKAVQALREVFDHRMGYSPEDVKRFRELLAAGEGGSIMNEYRDFVLERVSRAFLSSYADLAREIFDKYIREAEFAREQKRKFVRGHMTEIARDAVTGKPKEPDVKFLRSVEEHAGVGEAEAEVFRGEILEYRGQLLASGQEFGYDTYEPLRRAVEKKLLNEAKATLSLVLATDRPQSQEERKRAKDLYDGLLDGGCCGKCAAEFIEKAAEFLSE